MASIQLSGYDFVDFGCSTGGSLAFGRQAFNARTALGIDIDPAKVRKARDAGHDAMLADATDPAQFGGKVRFATLSHFLEHLPDYDSVRRALATAIRISEEFVFIREPWFDSDGGLFRRGLKFYWSDWQGHRMTLTSLEIYRCIRNHAQAGEIVRATLFGNIPVLTSDDASIVPLSAPVDSGKYDPAFHGPKPQPPVPIDGYRELMAVLAIRDPQVTDSLLGHFPDAVPIYDDHRDDNLYSGGHSGARQFA